MAQLRWLTHTRMKEVLRRQDPPRFGKKYEPGIKPTREEAPAKSSPAWVPVARLGRRVSTLSAPERLVLPVLVRNRAVFEIHEQRMLPFSRRKHPLHEHPRARGLTLPETRGTLAIADEMGFLDLHPVAVADRNKGEEPVPGCWFGDYLVFCQEDGSPARCVNISVKEDRADFEVDPIRITVKTNLTQARRETWVRHLVEERLYAEWGIPTVRVASNELPAPLVHNLERLLPMMARRHRLTPEEVDTVLGALNMGLREGSSALEVMRNLELAHGIPFDEQKLVLDQAMFEGRLPIDLENAYFMPDQPMRLQAGDPLRHFAHWFRSAP
jgi:hypothetical protein